MKTRLYVGRVKYSGKYLKSFKLSTRDLFVELKEYDKKYEEYVQPLIAYYAGADEILVSTLQVKNIVKKGEYIMGIFGGEEKKGKETYAGLVVTDKKYDPILDRLYIKLYRMNEFIEVSTRIFNKYRCNIYKLIYRGCVHPFIVSCIYDILLSRKGKDSLKEFIKSIIIENENRLLETEKRKLEILQKELIQPDYIKTLIPKRYYVIYRCQRTFSAVVFSPNTDSFIVESHLAYIDCDNEADKAYFYAAALNYLAYKAIQLKRSFIRDQFARPIKALIGAELTWKNFVERCI